MPVSFAGTTGASMHGAIIPIATTTLATATTTVTFSNIPQGYQDLM